MPRLTGMWTHLSRQSVGGVGLRGPGETQLESDRREIGKRIAFIKGQLSEVHRHRELYRSRRRDAGVPVAALVGYTNAGKSTMLNALSGAGVVAEDKLFATLDPTTRRVELPSGREVLVTDTVGFINNLPTMVIAAFRSTLEEINEATLLIHILDVTHPNALEQAGTVATVLEDLGCDDKPVILVFNKIDLLREEDAGRVEELRQRIAATGAVTVSAVTGTGMDDLLGQIEGALETEQKFVTVRMTVPYPRSELVDRFHTVGRVEETTYDERGTTLTGLVPERHLGEFAPFAVITGGEGAKAVAATEPENAESAA